MQSWGKLQRQLFRQIDNPLWFQGQYHDKETDLHYNRHRYYDPHTARFTTLDPIGLAGGLNNYQYVLNPTGWVDPLGLSQVEAGGPCCGNVSNNATEWVRPRGWRLPATKGHWNGAAGDSGWISQKDSVNAVTGNKPIPFKESYPDFTEWSQGTFQFDNLTGKNSDFSVVHEAVAKEYGFKNKTQAKNFLREVGLTPHHYQDSITIQLIPSALHNEIPHIGGAAKLRNGG